MRDAPPAAWILTGPSGAGKATALTALQEAGIDAVDNLPVALLRGFVSLPRTRSEVAVIDARQGEALFDLDGVGGARVLFLDARDDVLVRRLNERTRPHALARGKGLDAVNVERDLLTPLRAAADTVIDTSEMTPEQLGARIRDIVIGRAVTRGLLCTVSSFGYKYGPQLEADWVIDSRLMSNPFWEPELRPLTGLDQAVRDYVLALPEAKNLLLELAPLVVWASERCAEHNRHYLHVAVGCTGGRHRSVVLAEELAARLRQDNIDVEVRHRDVHRPDPR
jgi:RNase adapter protein RapZ